MSKPEAALWEKIRDGMAGRWHAQRHEDRYSTGIPDVSFGINRRAEGWIELKQLPDEPKLDRVFDFSYNHFTADQRNWLSSRAAHGTGRVFLLCQFGQAQTAIWHWPVLERGLGKLTFGQLQLQASAVWWRNQISFPELVTVLSDNRRIPAKLKV